MIETISLSFKNNHLLPILYGEKNFNLHLIEFLLKIQISSRGNYISISGDSNDVSIAAALLEALYFTLENGADEIKEEDIKKFIKNINNNSLTLTSKNVNQNECVIKTKSKAIYPYNDAQLKYINELNNKDVVFGIGAAGTGKTYLAVAIAVKMFLEKRVKRIILTRPAVEAGEKLGFLPGDIKEKIDPYLQPLYDALYDMFPSESVERYITTKEIQIAPLAFMRGRTLSNAYVILDEAQNSTIPQMKMFLTRLGMGSKMAITGDLSQVDLPSYSPSGLIDAIERLKKFEEIGVIRFDSRDVVRHPLTSKIIEAYE